SPAAHPGDLAAAAGADRRDSVARAVAVGAGGGASGRWLVGSLGSGSPGGPTTQPLNGPPSVRSGAALSATSGRPPPRTYPDGGECGGGGASLPAAGRHSAGPGTGGRPA